MTNFNKLYKETDINKIKKILFDLSNEENRKFKIKDFILRWLKKTMYIHNIKKGIIAEIGGSSKTILKSYQFKNFDVENLSLFPEKNINTKVANISFCPQIPDNYYDVVFSISVLEHVPYIFNAADNIVRITKPGGLIINIAPFSYFYHSAPGDFWRYSIDTFNLLFESMENRRSFFYNRNRRSNNLGSQNNHITKSGGKVFKEDAFGGWRENWHTFFSCTKPVNNSNYYELKKSYIIKNLLRILEDYKLKKESKSKIEDCLYILNLIKFDNRFNSFSINKSDIYFNKIEFNMKKISQIRKNTSIKSNYDRFNFCEALKYFQVIEKRN